MAYADQEMSGSKTVSILIVVLIHAALGYLLVTGLAYQGVKAALEELEIVDITEEEEPEEEPPPPPPPPEQRVEPPPVVSPPPLVRTPAPPPQVTTQRESPRVFAPSDLPSDLLGPPPAPAPAPAPTPSQARGVEPRGSVGQWASRVQNSYPRRAINEEREGEVRFRLAVGADGNPTGCTVTRSSGHADLDDAACKAIVRVARFKPALNAAGDPIASTWDSGVRFELDNVR